VVIIYVDNGDTGQVELCELPHLLAIILDKMLAKVDVYFSKIVGIPLGEEIEGVYKVFCLGDNDASGRSRTHFWERPKFFIEFV